MSQLELALQDLHEAHLLDLQVRIAETPAPTFDEGQRTELIAEMWRAQGLLVTVDAVGNVIATRDASLPGPYLAVSAHLDHVFPRGQDIRVRRPGDDCPFCGEIVSEDELHGPGISDCAAGLAAVTGIIDALQAHSVETAAPLVFVATVGEEALGNLRGVTAFFDSEWGDRVGAFVSADIPVRGAIVHETVASTKWTVRITGPGGHAWDDGGVFSPIHAAALAAARIALIEMPNDPRSVCNIGLFNAGRSINAIPEEAEFHVDLRSVDPAMLVSLGEQLRAAAEDGFREYSLLARGEGELSVTIGGERPGGSIPRDHRLVAAATAALADEGFAARYGPGSLDANLPLSRGIPAIGISWGGSSKKLHSERETYRPAGRVEGVRALLRLAATFRP